MIQFNELRIEDNNLIVDVSVLDITEDTNHDVGIDYIGVGFSTNTDLTDYFGHIDDSPATIFTRVDREVEAGPIRGFRMVLPIIDENINKLVYVYVTVDPNGVDIPCTIRDNIKGYVYDRCLLFNKVFDFIKATDNKCADLDAYANYIVQIKGLELAVESGNFTLANNYWNKFFANNTVGSSTNTCNCNG